MQFIVQTIIDKIKEYNKISLFFHELPDFDALGACFALKVYLQYKHPEKEVKIIGLDVLEEQFSLGFFEFSNDHIPNSFLAESLGIILDTSVQSRI
jgi:phosphoesterase RecJ-like protein